MHVHTFMYIITLHHNGKIDIAELESCKPLKRPTIIKKNYYCAISNYPNYKVIILIVKYYGGYWLVHQFCH